MPGGNGNLIYRLDERPPPATLLLLAVQHVIVLTGVGLAFPLVVSRAIGLGAEETGRFIAVSMLASGAATLLQGLNGRLVGSGFLAPAATGPAWLPATLLAAHSGGLAAVSGMTLAAGLAAVPVARLLPRLRALFPTEVTGTVTLMMGVSLVPVAVRAVFGAELESAAGRGPTLLTGLGTLAVFVAVGSWSAAGRLRLYVPLLAIAVGCVIAAATGLMTSAAAAEVLAAPLLALPRLAPWGWSFDPLLIVPFTVAVVGASLKTLGDITACQRVNDPDWKRLELTTATGGVVANSLATAAAGLIGGMGQHTYSANVGLAIATGATARIIGIVAGALMLAFAFSPKLAMALNVIPDPVLGALLVFAAAFMTVTGMQIITSRMLDMRKTFVVALPVIFGLAVGFEPGLHEGMPSWMQPIFGSSLSTATILAVVLNLLLRIGIATTAHLTLEPDAPVGEGIGMFLERQGQAWGAQPEVIRDAVACHTELIESIRRQGLAEGAVEIAVTFDELSLRSRIAYRGTPIAIAARRPTERELLEQEAALEALAAYMAAAYASEIRVRERAGTTDIDLLFHH